MGETRTKPKIEIKMQTLKEAKQIVDSERSLKRAEEALKLMSVKASLYLVTGRFLSLIIGTTVTGIIDEEVTELNIMGITEKLFSKFGRDRGKWNIWIYLTDNKYVLISMDEKDKVPVITFNNSYYEPADLVGEKKEDLLMALAKYLS